MHSRSRLATDLRALGLSAGDTVMVHASIRAVGEIAGGPDEIHLAIKDVITPTGTLVMYASCPRHVDEIGRGNLSPALEAELLEKLPAFDPETARSARDNGALVELLRTWPGSRVNPHVVRFVAWGKHVADLPGKRVTRYQVPVLENGARVWRWMEEIDTSEAGAHAHWPDRFFARIVDALLKATSNEGGCVGDARTHLIRARDLYDFARPIMELVARDARAADELLTSV